MGYVAQWQEMIGAVADDQFGPKTLARSVDVANQAGIVLPTPKRPDAWALGPKSLTKLKGVEPGLVSVVKQAVSISTVEFIVLEGLRTQARQEQLLARGATRTLDSRHLTGHAVDLAAWLDGKVSWHWPHYHQIAAAMKEAAESQGYPLTWGGDWKSFPDGPHFQRTWRA